MNGTHTNPAFCSQIVFSTPSFTYTCPSPPRPPSKAPVTTTGTTNCTSDTPRLPMPALSPVASPFFDFGKKKLILAMLELKLPPPRPHNSASASSVG